jgi:hypothetical protein
MTCSFSYISLLDVLHDVIDKVANGLLKPYISQTVKFTDSADVFETIDSSQLGKVIIEIGRDNF